MKMRHAVIQMNNYFREETTNTIIFLGFNRIFPLFSESFPQLLILFFIRKKPQTILWLSLWITFCEKSQATRLAFLMDLINVGWH